MMMKVNLATLVEGDPRAPFSKATTTMCRGGLYSLLLIATLYPWPLTYNVKRRLHQVPFLSLWHDYVVGLTPGLPDHWRTFCFLGQEQSFTIRRLYFSVDFWIFYHFICFLLSHIPLILFKVRLTSMSVSKDQFWNSSTVLNYFNWWSATIVKFCYFGLQFNLYSGFIFRVSCAKMFFFSGIRLT